MDAPRIVNVGGGNAGLRLAAELGCQLGDLGRARVALVYSATQWPTAGET